ncbi:MAG TPA: hypothetical protein VJ972_00105 [Anaerolineales bacterium]|nr:hypothetical protein [Anaerolineales bacterium]
MNYTDAQLRERLNQEFGESGVFYRDTTLPISVLKMYQVGIIFQEPTFCDATYKRSGMLAPHRYQIISSHARDLGPLSANPQWGLCIWSAGRYFKVIDNTRLGEYTQTTLLEIAEDLILYFRTNKFAYIEKDLAEQSVTDFKEAMQLPILPELNTKSWLDRLSNPLGISDELTFFNKVEATVD